MNPLIAIGIALGAITVALRQISGDEENSPRDLDEVQESVREARRQLRKAEKAKRDWLQKNEAEQLEEETEF